MNGTRRTAADETGRLPPGAGAGGDPGTTSA